MPSEFHCPLLEFIALPLLLHLSDSELWWASASSSLCDNHSRAFWRSNVCILQVFCIDSVIFLPHTHFFFWQFSFAAECSRLESLLLVSPLPSSVGEVLRWCSRQACLLILSQLNSVSFGLLYSHVSFSILSLSCSWVACLPLCHGPQLASLEIRLFLLLDNSLPSTYCFLFLVLSSLSPPLYKPSIVVTSLLFTLLWPLFPFWIFPPSVSFSVHRCNFI